MEAAGIAGATLSLVALPGLLASGIGALVFVGLDNWTGLGYLLAGADHGAAGGRRPRSRRWLGRCPWASLGALLGWVDPLARAVAAPPRAPQPGAGDRGLGLLIGLSPWPTSSSPDNSFTQVLFSGQDALPELVANAADYSVGVLLAARRCARRSPTVSR